MVAGDTTIAPLAPRARGVAATMPDLELTLLDLADRLLDRGVVLAGEATISVAGVDLVYLGLNLVLSSVETIRRAGERRAPGPSGDQRLSVPSSGAPYSLHGPMPSPGAPGTASEDPLFSPAPLWRASPRDQEGAPEEPVAALEVASGREERVQGVLPAHLDVDPDGVESALARLVLTLVEFIRQLLDRQAVRRMEGGGLSDVQIERMGLALQRLEEKVGELCRAFGLDPRELNIDLGPLGDLM